MDIMGILHLAEQLVGFDIIVADKNKRINLDALALLDVESKDDIVTLGGSILFHYRSDLDIGEALVSIIRFSLIAGSFQHVFGNDVTHMDTEVLAQLFGVAAADTFEAYGGKLRTATKYNLKEDLVILDAGKQNLHILEESLLPEVVDSSGDFVTGDFHNIAHLKASDKKYHAAVQIVLVVNCDTTNFVCLGSKVVNIIIVTHHHLRPSSKRRHQEKE